MADGNNLMRCISTALSMPQMSHWKPWAWRDWKGPELLTHRPRQLCLSPQGAVQRAQQLMGPDGLCLVWTFASPLLTQ